MKGVIYARYSSDNQREESIEGQIHENTAYAEKNGITIVGHYIDRALSAKTDNRPEFQRMIKDSAKKGFDMVIVWKLDRLEVQLKEVRDSIDNIMKAIEKGVVTRSTKSRLEELEAEEEKITLNIKLEEAKRPKIAKEFIIFTLNKFRNLDLRFEKNKERLIDGLLKAIFVYDDYIKLILTFDDKPVNIPTSEEIEYMANSSDVASSASPANKKPTFMVGFLFTRDFGVKRTQQIRRICLFCARKKTFFCFLWAQNAVLIPVRVTKNEKSIAKAMLFSFLTIRWYPPLKTRSVLNMGSRVCPRARRACS